MYIKVILAGFLVLGVESEHPQGFQNPNPADVVHARCQLVVRVAARSLDNIGGLHVAQCGLQETGMVVRLLALSTSCA